MPTVYVSIGSNVEREKNIRSAVRALAEHFGPLTLSRVYETPAQGFDGEDFYNLVAAFATDEPVERVGDILTRIEDAHGRDRRGPRFGPRTLDLDLLLYGDLIRHDQRIDVPRREITSYAFVLGPLAELAPHARDPEGGKTYAELWADVETARRRLRPVSLDLDGQ